LKNWSPPDRDSKKLWPLFSKSLSKALRPLAMRNKIQWSRSDIRLPRDCLNCLGIFFQLYIVFSFPLSYYVGFSKAGRYRWCSAEHCSRLLASF
jgi:hypothetical protein